MYTIYVSMKNASRPFISVVNDTWTVCFIPNLLLVLVLVLILQSSSTQVLLESHQKLYKVVKHTDRGKLHFILFSTNFSTFLVALTTSVFDNCVFQQQRILIYIETYCIITLLLYVHACAYRYVMETDALLPWRLNRKEMN